MVFVSSLLSNSWRFRHFSSIIMTPFYFMVYLMRLGPWWIFNCISSISDHVRSYLFSISFHFDQYFIFYVLKTTFFLGPIFRLIFHYFSCFFSFWPHIHHYYSCLIMDKFLFHSFCMIFHLFFIFSVILG